MNPKGDNPIDPESVQPTEPGLHEPSSEDTTVLLSVKDARAAEPVVSPAYDQIPEDLRVPWDWADLAILVCLALAATFVLSMLLVIVFAWLGVSAAQIRTSPRITSFFAIANQILISFALLGYLAAQIRLRTNVPFWRAIGWRPLGTARIPRGLAYASLVAGAFFLEVLVTVISSAFAPTGKLPIQAVLDDNRTALLFMAMAVLLAPVVEETLFRGYIYPVVARSLGVTASVIFTGTLFGLLHAPQLWGGWAQIVLLILVGIVFTYVRAAMNTVLASYILHLGYNSFQVIGFLASTYLHGARHVPAMH